MSYTRNYDDKSLYIAPPQLAYLGVIKKNRIITPQESGSFILGGMSQQGPALLNIGLTSQAVGDVIQPELPSFLSPRDYELWVSKLPTAEGTPPAVGVYAAPTLAKSNTAPVFLLDILNPGEQLNIEGNMQLAVVGGDQDTAQVNLQLPPR